MPGSMLGSGAYPMEIHQRPEQMIKFGETITVNVAPLRSGADGGCVTAAVTASGQRFGAQSRAEAAAENDRAESR